MQLSRRRALWPAHAYARRPKCHFKHSRQVYLSRRRRDHDAEIAQRQGNPPVCTRSVAHRPSFTFEDPEEHKETQWPNGSLKSSVWAFRASGDGSCGGMSPTYETRVYFVLRNNILIR